MGISIDKIRYLRTKFISPFSGTHLGKCSDQSIQIFQGWSLEPESLYLFHCLLSLKWYPTIEAQFVGNRLLVRTNTIKLGLICILVSFEETVFKGLGTYTLPFTLSKSSSFCRRVLCQMVWQRNGGLFINLFNCILLLGKLDCVIALREGLKTFLGLNP